jgi:hypothetical protein
LVWRQFRLSGAFTDRGDRNGLDGRAENAFVQAPSAFGQKAEWAMVSIGVRTQ